MKRILILLISASMMYSLLSESLEWDQYLGNPGRKGYIDCNGPDSAEILWEVELPNFPGHPFISGDRVVVECGGRAVLIDLLTGTLLSDAVVDVKNLAAAYPLDDLILGTTNGGWLYRINPVTGEATFDVKIPDRFFCWAHCHPIVLSDSIIFPSTPVVCLSRSDYSTLWDLQSSLGSLYPEDAEVYTIAASSERLHIVFWGEELGVWTVDSDTGEFLWAEDRFKISLIAADESVLFAAGENLYALDAETGELLWTFEFESDHLSSNIMVGPHAIYATDSKRLYSVDKTTGVLKWITQWEENPFWITYIIGAKNTVICSDVRYLSCFSAEDGTELWKVHFQDIIEPFSKKPCPAVARGVLIVGGKEGNNSLIALASDPDLHLKQGNAFLSRNMKEEAIKSFEKAAELYKRKGDMSKSQEIRERIRELEILSGITPTTQPPESLPITTLPEPAYPIPLHVVALIVIVVGISAVYYFIGYRRSKSG